MHEPYPPVAKSKPYIKNDVLIGGLDVALRVDSTSFCSLKLSRDGILEENGLRQWEHGDPGIILNDMKKINDTQRHALIGYDRLGTGEFIQLAHKSIPFTPIVSSAPMKYDIIGLINERFSQKKLIIHNTELYKECLEQEKIISEAGNLLYRHPVGFHDDRFWSLGMAVKAADRFIKGVNLTKIHVAVPQTNETLENRIDREMKRELSKFG